MGALLLLLVLLLSAAMSLRGGCGDALGEAAIALANGLNGSGSVCELRVVVLPPPLVVVVR